MPYYNPQRGDYRTYGYGAGDPGFLSSLWKGVKKIALPIIGGMIAGPAGMAVGTALGGGGRTPPIVAAQTPQPRSNVGINLGPISARSTDFYPPVPQFRGTSMTAASRGKAGAVVGSSTGCCPVGYHLAKDGSGRCVRNRRMNVANPRALRRSMRRVQGFEKLAKRTISFTRRVKMKKS